MATSLELAGNLVALGAGHLQVVYRDTDNDILWELEVQSPSDFGLFGGNWDYFSRPHDNTSNTPGFGNSDRYAATVLLEGATADDAFDLLVQAFDDFEDFSPEFEYNVLSQNSNSFVNSLLSVIGIDLADVISGATPPDVDNGYPGDSLNVLTSNNVDGGPAKPSLSLAGSSQADTIVTGRGADTLLGGGGDDTLTTGSGNDSILPGDGTNNVNGGGGDDVVIYWDVSTGVAIGLDASPLSTSGQSVDQISGVEDAIGSTGDDWIFGNAGSNELAGYDGNDRIEGGGGADSLFGQNGDDLLRGDAGDDLLDGGAGNDTLTGGGGEDIFVFETNYDSDRITDFELGTDFIYFNDASVTGLSDLTFGTSGNDLTIDFDGTTIILENLATTPADFHFIFAQDLVVA